MNDIRLSSAIKKYGKDLGHVFNESRCSGCGIMQEEFLRNYPSSGLVGETILCDKILKDIENSKPKPRVQKNVSKKEFWNLLYNYFNDKGYMYHSFKDAFEYFWKKYKINRSTFRKLFNEIYHEQNFDGKNALHVYGSPSGSYRSEDRLPMDTLRGHKEWSLWGIDNFDKNNSSYEVSCK